MCSISLKLFRVYIPLCMLMPEIVKIQGIHMRFQTVRSHTSDLHKCVRNAGRQFVKLMSFITQKIVIITIERYRKSFLFEHIGEDEGHSRPPAGQPSAFRIYDRLL